MAYIEGFVVAVPAANKEKYRQHAEGALDFFKGLGVTRMVETWGDDVPDGKITDFKRSVQAKPDEVVLFSWLEYPSKAVRDAANDKMMNDPNMKDMGKDMPFDGQRMIFAGFETLVENGQGGLGGLGGHEDVVVAGAGHDIAADAGLAQRGGEGRGEADGLQVGMDLERDPGGAEQDLQAPCAGEALLQDHAEALPLPQGGDDAGAPELLAGRQGREHVHALVERRLHGPEQLVQGGDRSRRLHPSTRKGSFRPTSRAKFLRRSRWLWPTRVRAG